MSFNKSRLFTTGAFVGVLSATILGSGAFAQEGLTKDPEEQSTRIFDKVIVSATKRETTLQDAPLSINVVSGALLEEANLLRLDELAPYVPNLSITEGPGSTFIEIRGLGSGGNSGFDQSVGLFVDGVHNGRDRQFRAPFLDIERVEVLRGPQGTLFGKNTIAGAVSIHTARPGDELEALASVEYEPEFGGATGVGVLSTPLSDTFGVRFAAKHAETGAFLRNELLDEDDNERRESVGRASFTWEPTSQIDVTGKLEFSRFEKFGENLQLIRVGPGLLPLYQAFDPGFDALNDDRTSKGPENAETNTQSATLSVEYDLGGYQFSSITAYSAYDSFDDRDVDWSPVDFLREPVTQDFEQFSQEFRVASPVGEKFDYIAGVHAQSNSFLFQRLSSIELGILGFPEPFDIRASSLNSLDQDSNSYSVFAQGTWHLGDAWDVTAGLRYANEEKTGVQAECYTQVDVFACLDPANDPTTFAISQAGFDIIGFIPHSTRLTNKEENWSPSLNVKWRPNRNFMLYSSVNTGFKGGGFNGADRAGTNPTFEEETAVSYEFGGKTTLADGRANLNFAIFRTEYDDLQVSSFVNTDFIVGNAAKAISQGIEVDGYWQVTDRLSLAGSAAILDAEYDDYEGAGCSYAQLNLAVPGCDLTTETRDISGRDITGANASASLNVNYSRPLGETLRLEASMDANYTESVFVEFDPDRYGAYTILNGRITLMSASDRGWSLSLIGKNLTDHRFLSNIFDAPIQAGSRLGQRNAPRTVALRATLQY